MLICDYCLLYFCWFYFWLDWLYWFVFVFGFLCYCNFCLLTLYGGYFVLNFLRWFWFGGLWGLIVTNLLLVLMRICLLLLCFCLWFWLCICFWLVGVCFMLRYFEFNWFGFIVFDWWNSLGCLLPMVVCLVSCVCIFVWFGVLTWVFGFLFVTLRLLFCTVLMECLLLLICYFGTYTSVNCDLSICCLFCCFTLICVLLVFFCDLLYLTGAFCGWISLMFNVIGGRCVEFVLLFDKFLFCFGFWLLLSWRCFGCVDFEFCFICVWCSFTILFGWLLFVAWLFICFWWVFGFDLVVWL